MVWLKKKKVEENEKKESLNDNESLITWQQAIGRDKTFENFQASNPSSVFEVNNIFWRPFNAR